MTKDKCKATPGYACLRCEFPDCICTKQSCSKEEAAMLRMVKDYKKIAVGK